MRELLPWWIAVPACVVYVAFSWWMLRCIGALPVERPAETLEARKRAELERRDFHARILGRSEAERREMRECPICEAERTRSAEDRPHA